MLALLISSECCIARRGNSSGLCANRGNPRLWRPCRQREPRDDLLVYSAHRDQLTDVIPDTAVWICAVLFEGNRATVGRLGEYLSRNYPLCNPAAYRPCAGHLVASTRPVAAWPELIE